MLEIRDRKNLSENPGDAPMKKLKLPIIKESTVQTPRVLSMNEYFKFVQFNLTHTFDRKSYAKWKKILAVNVPFSLK